MGRHLFRLLRPDFALKMLRTKAAGLYGWDILFKGTLRPGPIIGERCREIITRTGSAGHETGLHAWDHHQWQARAHAWSRERALVALQKGLDMLKDITGAEPVSSAAPGWRCTNDILLAKEELDMDFHSDCRGNDIFYPLVNGRRLTCPQVPVTLPTYDEIVGRNGFQAGSFFDHLAGLLQPEKLNVLTIHAEAEGLACSGYFTKFMQTTLDRGWSFCPLGSIVRHMRQNNRIHPARMIQGRLSGREGWLAVQEQKKDSQ
jgi:undecaprenyl phosphate-alpha-L-ara4FN deformylase